MRLFRGIGKAIARARRRELREQAEERARQAAEAERQRRVQADHAAQVEAERERRGDGLREEWAANKREAIRQHERREYQADLKARLARKAQLEARLAGSPERVRAWLDSVVAAFGLDDETTAAFKGMKLAEQARIVQAAGDDLAAVLPIYLACGDKHQRRDAWDAYEKSGLPFRAAVETFYLTRELQ